MSESVRPSLLYLRNIGFFLIVAIPITIIIDIVVEIGVLGMFPNLHTSLPAFLELLFLRWYVFAGPGGALVSIIHTFLLLRSHVQARPMLLRRSIFYALLLSAAYAVFLSVVLLLMFGGGGFFIVPGALVYGWLVGRFTARRDPETQSSSPS